MSETMTELKPCPFCGARAELVEVGINSYVRCPTCHANSDDMSADRAIEKWNARSPPPPM